MAKKVVLDTLEVQELEIPLPERTAPPEEVEGARPEKRPAAKWRWISALALVMLLAAGGVAYWWISNPKTAVPLPSKGVPTAASRQKGPLTAQANDFIITFQDDKGKYLVLICDLTFELSAGQEVIFRQNLVAVRKNIYEILKKTRWVFQAGPRSRDELKEEINKSLSGVLGEDAIKAIYFTKFVVL